MNSAVCGYRAARFQSGHQVNSVRKICLSHRTMKMDCLPYVNNAHNYARTKSNEYILEISQNYLRAGTTNCEIEFAWPNNSCAKILTS